MCASWSDESVKSSRAASFVTRPLFVRGGLVEALGRSGEFAARGPFN